ncbi:MAG TPA: hypothetical protein VFV58_39280 [Blastocatellia bacterium]|jgi:hypothetical protein|nr:hypothetical protein [Blastocatellia bacterium]
MYHVAEMKQSLKAGRTFPPIIICAKSRRIVDGFHRYKLYLSLHGKEYPVEVVTRNYKTDGELFMDAMRLNADHGRKLTNIDRIRCQLIGQKLELTVDQTAAALGVTVMKLGELRLNRLGELNVPGQKKPQPIPLKRAAAHMSGMTLTGEQVEVNKRLGGATQTFMIRQVIDLLESGLMDLANDDVRKALERLAGLLSGKTMTAA